MRFTAVLALLTRSDSSWSTLTLDIFIFRVVADNLPSSEHHHCLGHVNVSPSRKATVPSASAKQALVITNLLARRLAPLLHLPLRCGHPLACSHKVGHRDSAFRTSSSHLEVGA
ncbi:hypothetical protein BKA91DRAFT_142249 [Yarrowia lipolytica]|nr:hypothetical protein BKA91DRAFT_142249 [Yarrowia lipolytica]KAE8173982.1 hypothetical protein BKA90DRAFT_134598 [Yarrowia lipolytica]RMI95238.1 hypothetical protein BD777DRAFT_130534 [Yarrowia lipolytica]